MGSERRWSTQLNANAGATKDCEERPAPRARFSPEGGGGAKSQELTPCPNSELRTAQCPGGGGGRLLVTRFCIRRICIRFDPR